MAIDPSTIRQSTRATTAAEIAAIARWRRQQALGRTWLRRPDLLDREALSKADRALLEDFLADHHEAKKPL